MKFSPDIAAARILIVDDQDSNVRLLERMLSEAGYTRVQSTRDPTQVCALHREQPFDLILLDLQMPAMDGFAVMAALQTNEQEDYLPVIVLTAQPAQKLRALQAGAKDFISKPFDLLEVKTRIHNMLEVRLLYRKLQSYSQELEQAVAERTAALRESEARFRSLTELATDWYWEQDAAGQVVKVSGPVLEMLGLRVAPLTAAALDAVAVPALVVTPGGEDAAAPAAARSAVADPSHAADPADTADMGDAPGATDAAAAPDGCDVGEGGGWNLAERRVLHDHIAARRPFLDFIFHRALNDGGSQRFRVSGQPMFDQSCRFLGYRGVGVEIAAGC